MTNRNLAVIDDTPKDIVARGSDQAHALMDVIKQAQGVSVDIKGRKFLRFEAWQTIARFNHASAVIEWTRPLLDQGNTIGFEARAQVVTLEGGTVIGSAEAMCGLDEFVTRGQATSVAKMNAARSMAQTRAAAKALRMVFSYVAVLAGYEPTPAEEIGQEAEEQATPRPAAAPKEATGATRWFSEAKALGFTPQNALRALGVADFGKIPNPAQALEDLRDMAGKTKGGAP